MQSHIRGPLGSVCWGMRCTKGKSATWSFCGLISMDKPSISPPRCSRPYFIFPQMMWMPRGILSEAGQSTAQAAGAGSSVAVQTCWQPVTFVLCHWVLVTHASPTHRLGTELCTLKSLLAPYQVDKSSVSLSRGSTAQSSELPLHFLTRCASSHGGGKAATQIGSRKSRNIPA